MTNDLARIRIIEGADADTALADARFLAEWSALVRGCPWATGFQAPGFVLAWYQAYRQGVRPLIVAGTSSADSVCALLMLAVAADGTIVSAGGRQAEYQSWVTASGIEATFAKEALLALRSRIGNGVLRLQYLPPDLPVDVLTDGSLPFCVVEDVRRPLMALSGDDIEQSWRKKSNKSRLNRLAKQGELTFDHVLSPEILRDALDEIATMYDVRQASISGTLPFYDDPQKADFHLRLMETPGLLHVTMLRVGGTLVSAHIGVASGQMAHIGILAHSPFFARHSPGKLHVMFLARQLASEGVTMLDLTPGADVWKERSATSYDVVKRLTVFATEADRRQQDRRHRLKARIKAAATTAGISPKGAAGLVEAVRKKSPSEVLRSVGNRAKAVLPHTVELRAYAMELPLHSAYESGSARRDTIADLLRFQEQAETPSRQEFYRTALARLEQGHHCYTVVEQGRLVHWGWLAEGQDRGFLEEVHQPFTYPSGSVALYDFYTDPAFRGRGLYTASIGQMLNDASAAGHQRAWIFVTADNRASRSVVEKARLAYVLSLFERITLGRSTKWRTDGPVETDVKPDENQDEPAPTSS